MHIFLTKAVNWFYAMSTTRTTTGPWMYFQRAYLMHTLATLLRRLHLPGYRQLRRHLEHTYNTEVVIKNSLGTFSINSKNDSLTKSIPSFEYYHQPWLDTTKTRGLFIDIGANIGFYSLLAIKHYGYQSAHAFEPNPETYNRLAKNVTLNKLTGAIHLHPIALSSEVGNTHFQANPTHTGASSLSATASDSTITVPTTTFDAFCKAERITPSDISFIKIDVEGFEHDVLTGMQNALSELPTGCCIFIESDPSHPKSAAVHIILKYAGFQLLASTRQHNFLYQKA